MKEKSVYIVLCMFLLLSSCNKNRFEIDTDKVDLSVKIERFDRDFMQMDTVRLEESVVKLEQKYGVFFNRYVQNVLGLGVPQTPEFAANLRAFLADSTMHEIYVECQKIFPDSYTDSISREVQTAFRYVKHYFPERKIPRVAMHISGFNQSVVAAGDVLSVSIDNYLGVDYALYRGRVFDYQLRTMTPDKVAPDLLLGYLMSEFEVETSGNLLGYMLSRAKVLYLQSIFMPGRSEADLMGYTPEQEAWCRANESQMWLYLVEHKQLYNTSQLVISKYINPAPFTTYFTQDSPGQAGIWLGLQIVKSYMASNTSVSLPELMQNTDYQQILEKSNYKP
ncbi:MAG: hypothetical protein LBR81_02945 [Prevotellaceae bacterium]|nr:hypothetical protein [Prevotellaceae bacterium]